jgi:seryl-tRNA synthetase
VIDLRQLRDDPDRARASQRLRGADETLVDALLAADDERRAAVSRADDLRAEQKSASHAVSAANPDERPHALAQARRVADEVKAAEAEQARADQLLRAAHLAVPNIVEDGVPPGGEDDFVTLETVGTPPVVAAPRDHTEIGAELKAIDTDRGAKVSGARFYFLTGIGAQLELALVNLAMEQATADGFIPMIAPALVKP